MLLKNNKLKCDICGLFFKPGPSCKTVLIEPDNEYGREKLEHYCGECVLSDTDYLIGDKNDGM